MAVLTDYFRDLKSYQDTIATFSIHALHERFEFIRQLGNIFLVQPEILKSYITENYLGRIEPALLRPYLAQRSDWGHVEKGFTDESEDVSGRAGPKGLRDRFGMGRLSMMMKDLEGLRLGDSVQMGMSALPSGFAHGFSISSRTFGRGDTSALVRDHLIKVFIYSTPRSFRPLRHGTDSGLGTCIVIHL